MTTPLKGWSQRRTLKIPPARAGRCCGCGYEGEEETVCEARRDRCHCEHWWDGPERESDG
jgi:hypothetical protein